MHSDTQLTILQGIRILSFTQFLLGPAGVQYLADLGADVIKIEAPGGTLFEGNWAGCDLFLNGISAFYLCANRNQRSLTLNLRHPDGQAASKRLIAGADVMVQNFRSGVMERLGLAYDQVAPLNPHKRFSDCARFSFQFRANFAEPARWVEKGHGYRSSRGNGVFLWWR